MYAEAFIKVLQGLADDYLKTLDNCIKNAEYCTNYAYANIELRDFIKYVKEQFKIGV